MIQVQPRHRGGKPLDDLASSTLNSTLKHGGWVVRREGALDELEVVVEAKPEVAAAGGAAMEAAAQKVRQKIHGIVGISAGVKVVPPRTLERSIGKAKRVIDERPKT